MFGLDLPQFIQTIGYLGMFAIIFAESGLFFGFFLPGDSLLFTAGILASQGHLSIALVILLCFVAAVTGDSVGYAFGRRVGPKLFSRDDSRLFHKHHVTRAQAFYEKYGAKTIVLARFVPVVRTFAPILAGVGRMEYRTFLTYNLVGGVFWAIGLPALGYFLGNTIPNIDRYLVPGILVIIVLSILPPMVHFVVDRRKKSEVRSQKSE